MLRVGTVILAALFTTTPALATNATAQEKHQAHRHGAATLQVSVDGRTLHITLEGPADNLLGFEHAPRTEAQKKTVARADEQLKQPLGLFTTPPGAECRAQPARVDMKLPTGGSGETHSEVEAEWRWDCGQPGALTHVDLVGLFKAFPRLRQLTVQIITSQGQKTAVLKPGATRLKIAS
jgi:Protein of unknown function (DUF2796)